MSPRRPLARRAASAGLLAPVALAVLVAAPTAAHAASPACPTPPERLKLTWGLGAPDADLRTTTGHWGPRYDFRTLDVGRTGLGLGDDLEVRTSRDRHGVGRPVVCAGGKLRARLPSIRRGAIVGAASANGPWVAWRTARRGALGEVRVGHVDHGRLTAVKMRQTVRGVPHELVNGNFVVTPTGTVAWTVGPGPEGRDVRSVGAVWPRGRAVTAVPVPTGTAPGPDVPAVGHAIFVMDDQHVQVDSPGADPVRYRPRTPGTCPTPFTGTPRDLAGWSFTATAGILIGGHGVSGARGWMVCDPVTGELVRVGATREVGLSRTRPVDSLRIVARNGTWLVEEHTSVDPTGFSTSTHLTLTETVTGQRRDLGGYLAAPGLAPSPYRPNVGYYAQQPFEPGVAIAQGVTAWVAPVAPGSTTSDVWLSDAGGTRTVGSGSSITRLSTDGERLTWDADGSPRSAPVSPVQGAPFSVIEGVEAF
jgi:hypothetical protein